LALTEGFNWREDGAEADEEGRDCGGRLAWAYLWAWREGRAEAVGWERCIGLEDGGSGLEGLGLVEGLGNGWACGGMTVAPADGWEEMAWRTALTDWFVGTDRAAAGEGTGAVCCRAAAGLFLFNC